MPLEMNFDNITHVEMLHIFVALVAFTAGYWTDLLWQMTCTWWARRRRRKWIPK